MRRTLLPWSTYIVMKPSILGNLQMPINSEIQEKHTGYGSVGRTNLTQWQRALSAWAAHGDHTCSRERTPMQCLGHRKHYRHPRSHTGQGRAFRHFGNISHCSLGWPRTQFIDEAGLESRWFFCFSLPCACSTLPGYSVCFFNYTRFKWLFHLSNTYVMKTVYSTLVYFFNLTFVSRGHTVKKKNSSSRLHLNSFTGLNEN